MGPIEQEAKRHIRNAYAVSVVGQRLQAGGEISVNWANRDDTWNFVFAVFAGYRSVLEGLATEIDRLTERIATLESH